MFQFCRNKLKIEEKYRTLSLMLVQNYTQNLNGHPTFLHFIDLLSFKNVKQNENVTYYKIFNSTHQHVGH